jgi:transaldolase
LPDVYYVEALIAKDTVNTLPPDTLKAYRDHGKPKTRIVEQVAQAKEQLAALAKAGIKLDDHTTFLEVDGVAKFKASFATLLDGVNSKALALTGAD